MALRVASKARTAAARRRAHERRGAALAAVRLIDGPPSSPEDRERWTSVHEELGRLPETFRAPLVLCYLEGLTQEQAAARLEAPLGTIQSRLARGRAKSESAAGTTRHRRLGRDPRGGIHDRTTLPCATRLGRSHGSPGHAIHARDRNDGRR